MHTIKIVSGQTMADIDRQAIDDRGIPSLALMERAGWAVAEECHRLCANPRQRILVLCGKGNNGGDGWVAARHLLGRGYRPTVLASHDPETFSSDCRTNWERFAACPFSSWTVWNPETCLRLFHTKPVVIDALLGTGGLGLPRAPYDRLIDLANAHASWILGVDIPSGVEADTGQAPGAATDCRVTVTFGLPKKGHFLREGLDRTGTLEVADIGFPSDLLDTAQAPAEWITPEWVASQLPRFPTSTHKGTRGKVLLVAGSAPLLGAALLAAKGALAAGAGLVTLALPQSLNASAKSHVPEAMTLLLPETEEGTLAAAALETILQFSESADAVAVGPGLGSHSETRSLVRRLVSRLEGPLVLDADGLNACADSEGTEILTKRSAPTLLTPHPGELARLLGMTSPAEIEADRWTLASQASARLNSTLLLKGAATIVAQTGQPLLVNRTGHPAMAQGGMGDALTGILLAFLGLGMSPYSAAGCGAFLHGKAGEMAAALQGPVAITASQLIDRLGAAFRDLYSHDAIERQSAAPISLTEKRKG